MSVLQGSQAASLQREIIGRLRIRITSAESKVLENPTEANLSELRAALEASRAWRESQHG